jgi:hypothetical protein
MRVSSSNKDPNVIEKIFMDLCIPSSLQNALDGAHYSFVQDEETGQQGMWQVNIRKVISAYLIRKNF